MREVLQWLAAGGTAGSGLVVSGPPGVGKSALLARLVTLAHSDHRPKAQAAGALRDIPSEEIPDEGVVSVAIHARAKKSSEVALEIAVGLGGNLVGASDDLLGAVHSAIANVSIAMAAAGESPKRSIVIVMRPPPDAMRKSACLPSAAECSLIFCSTCSV